MSIKPEHRIHPKGHKLHLEPIFSKLALSDAADIKEAIDIVYNVRNKNINNNDNIRYKIKQWAKGRTTVSALRNADVEEWNQLRIPLMLRTYLRCLVEQAHDLSFKEILECQFNQGMEVKWNKWESKMERILKLGFNRKIGLEALMVHDGDMEKALEYICFDEQNRQYFREKRAKEVNKAVTFDYHHTVVAARNEAKSELEKWMKKSGAELNMELKRIRGVLEETRKRRRAREDDLQKAKHGRDIKLFKTFMEGILVNNLIGPSEVQHIERQRKDRTIEDDEYKEVLGELGTSAEKIEEMKQFDGGEMDDQNECVICNDENKTVFCSPCNHVCFCEDCLDLFKSQETLKCPMCSKLVENCYHIANLDENIGDGPG